jgi:hypothetical protein
MILLHSGGAMSTGQSWEFHVRRLGLHKRGQRVRTYGSYQVNIDGNPIAELSGNVCESIGPGRNHPAENGLRIEAGRYQLTTQFGRYVSIGFSTSTQVAAQPHMPAICLADTGARTGILIHPGHPKKVGGNPPVSFLSSIGCFNLTRPLGPQDDINFFESRLRVIALIDSLAAFDPSAFHDANGHPIKSNTKIKGAFAVVDGEPMNALTDSPAVA